jgi:hypothetical protein
MEINPKSKIQNPSPLLMLDFNDHVDVTARGEVGGEGDLMGVGDGDKIV